MVKKKEPAKPIVQCTHDDKERVNNLPVGLVTPDTDKDAGKKTYQYDPHLDPQLLVAAILSDTRQRFVVTSRLHILFDRGYLTITDNMTVEVSRRIKEEFEKGLDYYAMHGKSLKVLPSKATDRPASNYITWHNENIFRP